MPHFYLQAGCSGILGGWVRPVGRRVVMAVMVAGGGGGCPVILQCGFHKEQKMGVPVLAPLQKSLGNLSVSFLIFVPLDLSFPTCKIKEMD